MSEPRKASADFYFNGKSVTTDLKGYLKSVSYTDPASEDSDGLDITLQNIGMDWMGRKYPQKGDRVSGSLLFRNWEREGVDEKLECGSFVLDNVSFSGGPLEVKMQCLSVPEDGSFKTRECTKVWKEVTVKGIAREIARKHGLAMRYSGPEITIKSIEQSQKTDSDFLVEICDKYGLKLKVYNQSIVVYDQTEMEKKKSIATLGRELFIDDNWEYEDSLEGTYTGARISYKSADDSEEISVYIGLTAEDAQGARVLKINETADSVSDAYYKAAAQVNKSNESATTISGEIWANPRICAGATVKVTGMGRADGKYFVDKSTIELSDSGTKQSLEMHKCQPRLAYAPRAAVPAPVSGGGSKDYKAGDIVQFNGGTHYLSSHADAGGSPAKEGPAKITLTPDCAGNGGAHPWHLVHTDNTSNVYGWVDEGTFS